MPLYLYRCTSCEHEWEEVRFVSQRDKDITCPKCQSKGTKIPNFSGGIQLKHMPFESGAKHWGDN